MASPDRKTPDSLIAELAREPYGFDFYRAVRLLESLHPDLPRIGYSETPAQDPIRFGQSPTLLFAASTLDSVTVPAKDGQMPRLKQNFFGVFGPNGPLPQHLTEYARDRSRHDGDETLTAFADVFHHRMLSFFYRAWAANQKVADLDRPDEQRFAYYIGAFGGLGMDSLRNSDAVPDWAKLYFVGRLASQTRNPEGLETILQDFFGIRTEVHTFVGHWMDIPDDSICRLGDSPDTGRLGLTTLMGSRIWDCQSNFRIKLGPMRLADFERMLPSGASFGRLRHWVLNYLGEIFFWDIQLVLQANEVPQTQLGRRGQLGWTTWLRDTPPGEDADELIFVPPRS
jgi:type VI secretion system protein ImpH